MQKITIIQRMTAFTSTLALTNHSIGVATRRFQHDRMYPRPKHGSGMLHTIPQKSHYNLLLFLVLNFDCEDIYKTNTATAQLKRHVLYGPWGYQNFCSVSPYQAAPTMKQSVSY